MGKGEREGKGQREGKRQTKPTKAVPWNQAWSSLPTKALPTKAEVTNCEAIPTTLQIPNGQEIPIASKTVPTKGLHPKNGTEPTKAPAFTIATPAPTVAISKICAISSTPWRNCTGKISSSKERSSQEDPFVEFVVFDQWELPQPFGDFIIKRPVLILVSV